MAEDALQRRVAAWVIGRKSRPGYLCFDLDGTLVKYGTEILLPGAVDVLKKAVSLKMPVYMLSYNITGEEIAERLGITEYFTGGFICVIGRFKTDDFERATGYSALDAVLFDDTFVQVASFNYMGGGAGMHVIDDNIVAAWNKFIKYGGYDPKYLASEAQPTMSSKKFIFY